MTHFPELPAAVRNWRSRGILTYADYWALFGQYVAERRTTGPEQSESLIHYSDLNYKRSERVEKTIQIPADIHTCLERLATRHTWLVLTEIWCGDSAQNLPYLARMASASHGKVELYCLLRDENPDLMDAFLTAGTRSIPKLMGLDEHDRVRYTWGPRPAPAQQIVTDWKAHPAVSREEMYSQLHLWYARNRGQALFQEFCALLSSPEHG